MRRTKIVATIGPKSSDASVLRKMINAGMDVARLNFSHGTHADHERSFRVIRKLSAAIGKPIGIIGDLQGPRIRIGEIGDEPLVLRAGDRLVVTTRKVKAGDGIVPTTYGRFHRDVTRGDRVLINDGSIELRVERVDDRDVCCRVIRGGALSSHKGINLPGIRVSEPSLTRKDREDVRFAAQLGVDYIALSFVRSANDVKRLKRLLENLGVSIPIIAKVEKPEAVADIDVIVSVADGIMIARGDLGVEMAPEKVPQLQKDIIRRCARAGKTVITATQMLESMTREATPTRAEASDVVNAIYDGTGAVMLSAETAIGRYPVEAVAMMARIAQEADTYVMENDIERGKKITCRLGYDFAFSFEDAIGLSIVTAATRVQARLIVCFTSSGFTAQHVAAYQPEVPIIAATQHSEVVPRMSLYWGVQSILVKEVGTIDAMITTVERELLRRRLVRKGDTIIITTGYPLGVSGTTNMMQLVRIGEHSGQESTRSGRGRKRRR